MSNELKSIAKMDLYSDMQVPVAVATWARQHKFNPLAVNILNRLKERDACTQQIDALEHKRDLAERELKQLCADVMEHKLGVAHGV